MTTIYHNADANPEAIAGQHIAVIGYGNQGRCWALNFRDSGCRVSVHVRADSSRQMARDDGFEAADIEAASSADIICMVVPDDVIPKLPVSPRDDALVIVASGYALAFDRLKLACDTGMIAPRMLGPEVRRCYEEGVGFITAVGVQQDTTGTARQRLLAVAKALGGLQQGAIEMTPHQEAVLDLAVEQVLSPALAHVNQAFIGAMLEQNIPLEAILTELTLSGEVERNYRLLREIGFVGQLDLHSPASQYGQLSRRGHFDDLDFKPSMRSMTDYIAKGKFADEWDAECEQGMPTLNALREQHAGPAIKDFEAGLRKQLGPDAA
ncbi:MAG TPA: hypothetical protein DIW43_02010 [Spongiibacteraceae bacterium]|nr:hypothetical protein [Spongiibacteraceae bacterium]HCS26197.1 hypothetical protein [Spongiibacteraceae bacterium]|tara:strand:+ start:242 stop:1210 length:969 start_codon:yes stop_codon:yes gene_type:complete